MKQHGSRYLISTKTGLSLKPNFGDRRVICFIKLALFKGSNFKGGCDEIQRVDKEFGYWNIFY